MKATFFSKPLEWNLETELESWSQGALIKGTLKVKNHSESSVTLDRPGVGLAWAEIKKVHAKTAGALKLETSQDLQTSSLGASESLELPFTLKLDENSMVSDKKGTYFLTYGQNALENHLQLKVEPRILYGKLIGLLDTFYRFKFKEYKSSKKSVEYKLIPPTARDMANLESLLLSMSMVEDRLHLKFDFQVKRLDTSGVTNKINKESVKLEKILSPKEYSLGKEMINQDTLLKVFEEVIGTVKLKSVF
jgi:hypothetical protein